jgi:hypothetical protein
MHCPITCPPNTAWLPGGVHSGFFDRNRFRSSTSSSRAPIRPSVSVLLLLLPPPPLTPLLEKHLLENDGSIQMCREDRGGANEKSGRSIAERARAEGPRQRHTPWSRFQRFTKMLTVQSSRVWLQLAASPSLSSRTALSTSQQYSSIYRAQAAVAMSELITCTRSRKFLFFNFFIPKMSLQCPEVISDAFTPHNESGSHIVV